MGECPLCQTRVTAKVIKETGRVEFVYASLLATRKVLDVYASIPAEKLSRICLTLWAQFNQALRNGVKLLASEADGWDLQHARSLLMLPDILHSQVKAMEEIISRRGLMSETAIDGKDVFIRILSKVQQALRWYEFSCVSRTEPQGLSTQPTDANGSLEVADPGESLPVLDDVFWQNFDDNWMLVGDGLST